MLTTCAIQASLLLILFSVLNAISVFFLYYILINLNCVFVFEDCPDENKVASFLYTYGKK